MEHRSSYIALGVSFGSGVASAVGVIAQAAGGSGAQVGDLISAGGSFSAAGALVYIVKKLTDGQLVSRDPARVEAQQTEQISRHQDLLRDSLDRERRLEVLYQSAIDRGGRQP